MKNLIFIYYFDGSHLKIAVLLTCREVLVGQLAIIFRVIFFVCQCWYYRWLWDCRVNYL